MRIGVVDLRDLGQRYAWFERALPRFLTAAGLSPSGPVIQRFAPPPVLVVICPDAEPERLERHAAWLAGAEVVWVVRERAPDVDVTSLELLEQAWATLPQARDPRFRWARWHPDAPAGPRPILEQARLQAADVTPAAPEPRHYENLVRALPAGPWITLPKPEGFVDLPALLARRLTWQGDRLVLWVGDGTEPVQIAPAAGTVTTPFEAGHRVACSPRGHRLANETWQRWTASAYGQPRDPFFAPGHVPLGFDPFHTVGWVGSRMFFDWLHTAPGAIGWLSATDHDFPCGPAKKQYGYLDNAPVRVTLSPRADVFLAVFERDALLSTAVPVRWRAAGDLHVADFEPDPNRAVLHVQGDEISAAHDPLDEDGHGGAPVIVLGPSPDVRYAVDLERVVHRIRATAPNEGEVATLGGPDEGYAVCDEEHRVVRLRRGRLVGGWWRWATVEARGAYFRVDLETDARERLETVEIPDLEAVPVPGTQNVLLLDARDAEAPRVRIL